MCKIYCFVLVGVLLSCSEPDEIPIKTLGNLEQPQAMNIYCQKSPGKIFQRFEYEYENNKLKLVVNLKDDVIYSETTYEYDSDVLKKETFDSDFTFSEKFYVYNDKDQLVNVIYNVKSYNAEGDLESDEKFEAPLEYENDLLVKKWELWGAYYIYEYEDGKIVTEYFYSQSGNLWHVIHKKYKNDLILEEKIVNARGDILSVRKFSYDKEQRLINITSEGNTVEEYIYMENRLMEKKTFYYGIDPGFDPCYGNYLYKYEY